MESVLHFSNLYSHPNKYLEEHSINVGKLAYENIEQAPLGDLYGVPKDTIALVAKVSGLCHDIGKSTKYFQNYLFADENTKRKLKNLPETHHAYLSAIVTYFEVKKSLEDFQILDEDRKLFLCFSAFLAVKRHHSNLEDATFEAIFDEEDLKVVMRQLDSIDEKKLLTLSENLLENGLPEPIGVENIKNGVEQFKLEIRTIRKKMRNIVSNPGIERYLLNNIIFSSLIDADILDVTVGKDVKRNPVNLTSDLVNTYKRTFILKEFPIDNLREKAYEEILNQKVKLDERILSLNLPTGLGKTLSTFAFAFNLRDKISKEKGYMPRIVYSLPFLSIVDQNFDVLKKVFSANNIDLDSSLALEHHHLAELRYIKEDDEIEDRHSKILIEGWNSEIIVTTFVQLFHTLFSNRKSTLRKFHRLSGSIIILDEVQSIPFKYWKLLNIFLKEMVSYFNSYVVLVTATEPLIFSKDDVKPLVAPEGYFRQMDRITLEVNSAEQTLEDFVSNLTIDSSKRYLFIMNTIYAAKSCYELLKDKLKDDDEIVFLSSHVTPYERMERINKLKEKNIKFAVTTQVIEAGVDIDFDIVYRDFAPLDSIIQAAGRCNRNWTDKGKVCVINLVDEKRPFSSYIYDAVLLNVTKNILQRSNSYNEADLYELVNEYYSVLQNKLSPDTSDEFIDALSNLRYSDALGNGTAISDFNLIEQDFLKLDVFLEINEEAKKVWEKYSEIKEIKDLNKRREQFDNIRKDFYQFVISIPSKGENIPPIINGFGYVNFDSLEDYYDSTTGFRVERRLAIW